MPELVEADTQVPLSVSSMDGITSIEKGALLPQMAPIEIPFPSPVEDEPAEPLAKRTKVEEPESTPAVVAAVSSAENVPPRVIDNVPAFPPRIFHNGDDFENSYSMKTVAVSRRRKRRRGYDDGLPKPKLIIDKDKPNFYGAVPGIPVGHVWATRMECSADGVMRPPLAGIHAGPEGAYSIVLSGGFEEDVDWGHCFTYTGEGGRAMRGIRGLPKSVRTGPFAKDQELTKGNLALTLNISSRKPVRVIRGSNACNKFAPEFGFRYDGLYTVEKFWDCLCRAGFKVYKFSLRRCQDQDPAPWLTEKDPENKDGESDSEDENNNEVAPPQEITSLPDVNVAEASTSTSIAA